MSRLLVVFALALAISLPAAASAGASPPEAAQTVAGCMQRSNHLLVDLEIDSSKSLESSDPENRRVDGISAALLGLTGLVERTKWEQPAPRIEVLLSSFAGTPSSHRSARDWHRITPGSKLFTQAESYRSRNHGRDTDYVLALKAARAALNKRAAAVSAPGQPAPCKAIVFFSDGGYYIGDRTGADHLPSSVPYAPKLDLDHPGAGEKAVRIGRHVLCDRNGVMDRIETNGIVLFTVALAGPEFSKKDRERLAAMTTGAAGHARCGSRLSSRTGRFITAQDSTELFFIFGDLLEQEPHPPVVCCPNPTQFQTELGMRGFVLSASGPQEGVEAELTDPEGESRVFSSDGPEDVHLAGTTIQQHWISGRALKLSAEFDPREHGWLGTWKLRFFAPGNTPVPASSLAFLSALRPAIKHPPPLVMGVPTQVRVHLVDELGAPAPEDELLRSARLRVAVVDGSGASRPAPASESAPGHFEVPVRVPPEVPDGDWKLQVETYFPGHGTTVKPSSARLDLGAPRSPSGPDFPWVILAVALALGLILVLLMDYRYRSTRARYARIGQLRFFEADAVVTPGERVEIDPDPGRLDFNDFKHLQPRGASAKVTSIQRDPFLLTVHLPLRFLNQAIGEASAPGRFLLGGTVDAEFAAAEDHRRCRVPLELSGTWLFAFAPLQGFEDVRGRLILFVDEEAATGFGAELLEAARAALREQDWEAFRRLPDEDTGEFDDPFDIDDEIDWESV